MANRIDLHNMLCEISGTDHVYFQPPESMKIKYPAIIYNRSDIHNEFADNGVYKQKVAYQIVVIDEDPESIIVDNISKLPMCRFNRHFTSDNLNHDVFIIYY